LFARIIAGTSWLIGFGSPSQHLVDVVGAYLPAILGALIVIPIYFIGKELASKPIGLIAAGLIAIIPGEFLGRSIFGFTDHHVAEVLFSASAVAFLLVALRNAREKNIGFGNLLRRESIRSIVFSLLAGVFMGAYLLTWIGGLLFVLIISVYFVIQCFINYIKNKPIGYLCIVGLLMFLMADILYLPADIHSLYTVVMLVATILPLILQTVIWFMAKRKLKAYYYFLILFGVGALAFGFSYLVLPSVVDTEILLSRLSAFAPSTGVMTTSETQPLLFPSGVFSLEVLWSNFGPLFYLGLVALGIIGYQSIKQGGDNKMLVVVWSLVILVLAMVQRRFAYYLAVNVALLSGYLMWTVINWVGSNVKAKKRYALIKGANVGLAFGMVFAVVCAPVMTSTVAVASTPLYAPSDAWCETLEWLRVNTPVPFKSDQTALYEIAGVKMSPSLQWVEHEPTYYWHELDEIPDYGVTAWWDYGYWITRIAHRVPVVNPGQMSELQRDVAEFFVSQDCTIDGGLGSEYVIIDYATVTVKFWGVTRHAGGSEQDYFGTYYVSEGSQLRAVQVYYPEYYQSLAVRLYNFNGEAVIPQTTIAITTQLMADKQGDVISVIADTKEFGDYSEALEFVESNEGYRIVGNNPLVSPIPLEKVENYHLAYASSGKILQWGQLLSEVKVFERE